MAATLVGLANGFRRVFWLSTTQYLGLLAGVLLGAAVAKPLLDDIGINGPSARSMGAVLVLIVGGSLGSSIGYAVGEPIRRNILRTGIHTSTDSVDGAALSTIAVLAMFWFLVSGDPRGGNTLEWATTSPPPLDNFETVPYVRSFMPLQDPAGEPVPMPTS